jgi:hypothetical protein
MGKGRRMFPEACLEACDGNPYRALHLAVRITRYRMIAALEIFPDWNEPLPLAVRETRDRELRAA